MDICSLLVPVVPPSSSSTDGGGGEHVQSEMRRDRVDDFRQGQEDEENVLRQMIGHSRSYVQPQFNQVEHSRSETNNSCEYVPASNLIRSGHLFAGIPLYLDDRVLITQPMLKQSEQLASLLAALAKQVFRIPLPTMHLFRDVDSGAFPSPRFSLDTPLTSSSVFQLGSPSTALVPCSSISVTSNKCSAMILRLNSEVHRHPVQQFVESLTSITWSPVMNSLTTST